MTNKLNMKTSKPKASTRKAFTVDENIKQFFPKVSHMGGINSQGGTWMSSRSKSVKQEEETPA